VSPAACDEPHGQGSHLRLVGRPRRLELRAGTAVDPQAAFPVHEQVGDGAGCREGSERAERRDIRDRGLGPTAVVAVAVAGSLVECPAVERPIAGGAVAGNPVVGGAPAAIARAPPGLAGTRPGRQRRLGPGDGLPRLPRRDGHETSAHDERR
jgi:hypothetical protein